MAFARRHLLFPAVLAISAGPPACATHRSATGEDNRGGTGGTSGVVTGVGGQTESGERPAICDLIDNPFTAAGGAAIAAALGDAAATCTILASSYDQSCTQDSDCVPVGEGKGCGAPCGPLCPSTAINVNAEATYRADLAKTPYGYCGFNCGCPVSGTPRCVHGKCTQGLLRLIPVDAGGADSGDADSGRADSGDAD
ncbi:MAG TPA: hypothetical protein VH062_32900 [Polyangiaceae bacterium]|jgi:hypothetical protein|nr:hypothetical protein [Polyangiaceae bacterium]